MANNKDKQQMINAFLRELEKRPLSILPVSAQPQIDQILGAEAVRRAALPSRAQVIGPTALSMALRPDIPLVTEFDKLQFQRAKAIRKKNGPK